MATPKHSKNYSTNLDATIELINRDAGKATTTAIRNIIDWIQALSVEGLMPLANQLETLEDLLSETQTDGSKIAECMEKISQLTLETASTEEGAQSEKIKELGDTLQRVAQHMRE